MKTVVIFLVMISSSLLFASSTAAPRISKSCVACHGANGISTAPLFPNLAGQNAKYLAKQLQDYQSGNRKDPIMTSVARTLNEQEIRVLVAYFTRLASEPSVQGK